MPRAETMSAKRMAAVIAALVWGVPGFALAAQPLMDQVCGPAGGQPRLVDKQRLAEFFLDEGAVRRSIEQGVRPGEGSLAGLSNAKRLLVMAEPCKDNLACGKDDGAKLDEVRGALKTFLLQTSSAYRSPKKITNETAFFVKEELQLECVADPVNPPGPVKLALPLVIRGDGDSLFVLRTDEPGAFKAAAKATASTANDGVKHKQTVKVVGVVGYPIPIKGAIFPLIPYVGINQNFTKTRGSDKSVTADTWNVGLASRWALPTVGRLTQWLGVRPDHLWNEDDGSRLATLNFNYRPILASVLGPVGVNTQSQPWSGQTPFIQPILEIHAVKGWYLDRGATPPEGRTDYLRIGPKIGVVLSSGDLTVPWNLTLSNVHLWGDKGTPRDIDYNAAALSFPIDPDQYISVDFTYANGRREDTGLREQLWGISLGAKY